MSEKQLPHQVLLVEEDGRKSYYHQVGVAWPIKDGLFSIDITPGMAVSGRLIIMPPKSPKAKEGEHAA